MAHATLVIFVHVAIKLLILADVQADLWIPWRCRQTLWWHCQEVAHCQPGRDSSDAGTCSCILLFRHDVRNVLVPAPLFYDMIQLVCSTPTCVWAGQCFLCLGTPPDVCCHHRAPVCTGAVQSANILECAFQVTQKLSPSSLFMCYEREYLWLKEWTYWLLRSLRYIQWSIHWWFSSRTARIEPG
jgi:hypothetical protein